MMAWLQIAISQNWQHKITPPPPSFFLVGRLKWERSKSNIPNPKVLFMCNWIPISRFALKNFQLLSLSNFSSLIFQLCISSNQETYTSVGIWHQRGAFHPERFTKVPTSLSSPKTTWKRHSSCNFFLKFKCPVSIIYGICIYQVGLPAIQLCKTITSWRCLTSDIVVISLSASVLNSIQPLRP